ncbi:MAG: carboxypeptidase-like regulatory domain-containing protein [Pseudomonadota bacterium]|nr:carboxypeptidase-like regulatory domain-containing protein [Pseudomonadota bacterium]
MNHMLKSALGAGLAAAVTAGLTACGGSSSSSGSSASTVSVTGVVTDPAISGAQVRIDNSAGNALASVVVTDDNGAFSFSGISASALDGAVITASGGEDAETGVDFTGLQLKGIYQDDGSAEVVTPLTTLIVEEMEASGSDYATARTTVATLLGLEESQLEADPDTDSAVQKLSLQLSLLGAALRAADGFDHVYELLENENGTDWTAISSYVQASDDYSDTIKERVAELEEELTAIGSISSSLSAAELVTEANRLSFITGVSEFLEDYLSYTAAEGSDGETNIQTLAEALWSANGYNGLPSDSAQFANLIRYVFNTYSISTTDLDTESWTIPAGISTDSQIASIAELDVIDHTIALTDEDLLTTSAEKLAYFYASDLSPAYLVQKLFSGVLDDNYVDSAFALIARNYARASMQDEVDVILKTQISMPYYQVEGYYQAAVGFINIGKTDLGLTYLDTAASKLTAYMEEKGSTNLDSDDAEMFRILATRYNKQGLTEKAEAILEPLYAFIKANAGTYSTAYGRIGTAASKTADALIEEAEAANLSSATLADALNAVEFYATILDGYGLQSSSSSCGDHYMTKAYGYTGLASFYARLQQADKTREAINNFIALRAEHACTSQRSDVYVRYLVEEYAYLDDIDGFLTMAKDTIQSDTYLTKAENAAAVFVALDLAKEGNIDEAIANITELYPDDTDASDLEDRLELLTNAGISESSVNSYLAVRLFDQGYTDAGAEALSEAWNIVTSDTYITAQSDDGSQLMYNGCSKIARMTYENVDTILGQSRMDTCADVATDFESLGSSLAISNAYTYLTTDALKINYSTLAAGAFTKAVAYANLLSGIDKIDALQDAVYYTMDQGLTDAGVDFDDVIAPLISAESGYNTLAASAASEDEYDDASDIARSIVATYNTMLYGMRSSVVKFGTYTGFSEDVAQVQTRATALIMDAENLVSQIVSEDSRDSYYCNLYGYGTCSSATEYLGIYDTMETLLDEMAETESSSSINNYRLTLAKHIINQDAFPGSDVATTDIDNDGMADFYEAYADDDEISSSGIVSDTDVDGDGTDDSMDATPFYAEI